MRSAPFAAIALGGMALTSVAVWSATGPAPSRARAAAAPGSAAAAAPGAAAAAAPGPDRSLFQSGKTLLLEGRLGHPIIHNAVDTETLLFVDVKADASQVATVSSPLDVAIVIDRSGSMKGMRMQNALAAARTMVDNLRDGDLVSVIAYDTRSEVVVPPTTIDARSRREVRARLGSMMARGDTCISCGIETAMRLVGRRPGMVSRILLLSDGEATAGVRDLDSFRLIAQRCEQMNASITSIGVDIDYNERIMSALARESNGRHYFVADASELPSIFASEMSTLQQTVANNAQLTVDLAPGVQLDHVFDRRFERQGNRVTVPLGAFAGDDEKTLLLRLRVPRGPEGERPIAKVALAYADLVGGSAGECAGELAAVATADAAKVSPLDGLVSARLSRSETAETLFQANDLARSGHAGDARTLLEAQRNQVRARRPMATATARGRGAGVTADLDAQEKALDGAHDTLDPFGSADDNRAPVKETEVSATDMSE